MAAFAVQATGQARVVVRAFQAAARAAMPMTLAVLIAPAALAAVMVKTVAQAMAAVVVAGIDVPQAADNLNVK